MTVFLHYNSSTNLFYSIFLFMQFKFNDVPILCYVNNIFNHLTNDIIIK